MGATATQAAMLGVDVHGTPVFVGSAVNHTVKGLTNGVVRGRTGDYKNEPAVSVDYPGRPGHVNRLSRLVVAQAAPTASTNIPTPFPVRDEVALDSYTPTAQAPLQVQAGRLHLTIGAELLANASSLQITSTPDGISVELE